MRTIEQFKKDFAQELNDGVLKIADTLTQASIFILRDGTIVDAEITEFGDRCTVHRQVLIDGRYSMDDLVTIEPETQTVILPVNGTTWEQYEALKGIDELYVCLAVMGSQKNDTNVLLIQYLIDCGCKWEVAQGVILSGSYAIISDEELVDYTDEEKEELIFLDNGDIVEVW